MMESTAIGNGNNNNNNNNSGGCLLDDIISRYEHPEKLVIKSKLAAEKLIQDIANGGPQRLQMIADFDMTLTKYHHNGEKCHTCHGIFDYSPLMPEDFKAKNNELRDFYYPMELDSTKTIQEKIPFMEEWYQRTHETLAATHIDRSLLPKLIAQSRAFLRDHAKEMLYLLKEAHVPMLIFSAGIGDMVDGVLKSNDVFLDNIKVISNYMIFDEDDKVIGFREPLIHMFNKNEATAHHSEYFHLLAQRHNAILIGDSLGDVQMCVGVPDHGAVLKIGFLNDKISERLESFKEAFDIVLVDDQSMDFLNLLIEIVLKKNTN